MGGLFTYRIYVIRGRMLVKAKGSGSDLETLDGPMCGCDAQIHFFLWATVSSKIT